MNRLLPLVLTICSSGYAATLGQWSGNASAGVWASSGNFSTIYSSATVGPQPHTIETTESLTAANLSNNTHFLIANPTYLPNSVEMAALRNWVYGGGILILEIDPYSIVNQYTFGKTNPDVVNGILASLGAGASGTTMQVQTPYVGGGGLITSGYLTGSDPAVSGLTNPGSNMLSFYQSYTVTGGQYLATAALPYSLGNTLRFDTFSLGKVYVLGDRFDQNGLMNNGSNAQFFLNLLGQTGYGFSAEPLDAPEPATLALTGFAILGLAAAVRRRAKTRS